MAIFNWYGCPTFIKINNFMQAGCNPNETLNFLLNAFTKMQ